MLKMFQDINMSMERTGEFGSAGAVGGSKAELLRMVAKNNVMRTGILSSKIGLTKRCDPGQCEGHIECLWTGKHIVPAMHIQEPRLWRECKVVHSRAAGS